MLRTHDDWERLVAAVLKKQQLWELFHAHSRSPSVSSEASSSDVSRSSSFREIDTSSAYWQELEDAVAKLENPVLRKLVLVSDFAPSFDVEDVDLASMELLGKGTFGGTYVGDVKNGVKIVVKRVTNQSLILSEEEFKNSMAVVGRLRHENIVPLRAYYCSQHERLMLYDYYGKGSVHQLLHRKTNTVGWQTRLTMAMGAARGLAFIHAQKLVHGNVKSSNVLLNKESYGCISDHGIAKLRAAELMKKSYCYAPEVKNSTKNVSQESDVYSFGILLFELLTRKSPVRFLGGPEKAVDLVKLMKSVKSKQMTPKVFDAELLKDQNNREQMVKVLQIGISCVAKSPKKRPKMSEVSKMLEDLGASLPKGTGLVFVHRNNESAAEDPFDLEIMLRASAEVLGKGTFGTSYKAILEIGLIVRVKRLKDANVTSAEFQQHIERVSRIKHKYCATTMAYSYSKDEVLLVYDYYDEDSLSTLLHGTLGSKKPLPWETRLKIALTAAIGINHIHNQDSSKFIHGNIRSANIFLDRNNNAIIADIALYKVTGPIRRSALKQQGYIAPEVKDTRNVSQASDVYSFGVVLLELLTRKPPSDTMAGDNAISLVKRAQVCVGAGNLDELFDAELVGDEQTFEALQLAMDCVVDVAERRPRMSQVVGKLQEISGIYDDEEQSERSSEYGSEDPKPWIGMRLEDALEDLASSLAFQQS